MGSEINIQKNDCYDYLRMKAKRWPAISHKEGAVVVITKISRKFTYLETLVTLCQMLLFGRQQKSGGGKMVLVKEDTVAGQKGPREKRLISKAPGMGIQEYRKKEKAGAIQSAVIFRRCSGVYRQ